MKKVAAIVFLGFAAAACQADEGCLSRPIKLAFYNFGKLYNEATGMGLDADVASELERRSGCKFEKVVMPRAKIWKDLESGIIDMTMSGVKTPERLEHFWFADYLSTKNVAIVAAGKAGDGRLGFERHSDYRFGVVRSFKHGEAHDKWLSSLASNQKIENKDYEEMVFKLEQGKVDAIFAQPLSMDKGMSDLIISGRFKLQDWFPEDPGVKGGIVLSKKAFDSTAARVWQKHIEEMAKDGTLMKLYQKYLPKDVAQQAGRF